APRDDPSRQSRCAHRARVARALRSPWVSDSRGGTYSALAGDMQEYDTPNRDPVCGTQIDHVDPKLRTEYADVLYSFCSQRCMQRFLEQPDIFTAEPGRGNVAER